MKLSMKINLFNYFPFVSKIRIKLVSMSEFDKHFAKTLTTWEVVTNCYRIHLLRILPTYSEVGLTWWLSCVPRRNYNSRSLWQVAPLAPILRTTDLVMNQFAEETISKVFITTFILENKEYFNDALLSWTSNNVNITSILFSGFCLLSLGSFRYWIKCSLCFVSDNEF